MGTAGRRGSARLPFGRFLRAGPGVSVPFVPSKFLGMLREKVKRRYPRDRGTGLGQAGAREPQKGQLRS